MDKLLVCERSQVYGVMTKLTKNDEMSASIRYFRTEIDESTDRFKMMHTALENTREKCRHEIEIKAMGWS